MHIDFEFEQIAIIIMGILAFLVIFNVFEFTKLLYSIIKNRGGYPKSEVIESEEDTSTPDSNEMLHDTLATETFEERLLSSIQTIKPEDISSDDEPYTFTDDRKNLLQRVKMLFKRIAKKQNNKAVHQTEANTQNGPEETLFGKMKTVLKRLFVDPINYNLFARKKSETVAIKLLSFQKDVPFILLWLLKIFTVNVVLGMVFFLLINKQFIAKYPQYKAIYPAENATWNDYTRPVEIEFDVPIDTNSLVINRHPDTPGYWEYEKSFPFLPYVRKIKFYPTETVYPGQKILFYLNDVSNHYHTMDGGEHLIVYYSIELPDIIETNPQDGDTDVSPREEIVITLNQKDGVYVDWDFAFDKEVAYSIIRNNTEQIRVEYTNPLKQGKEYTLTISQIPLAFNTDTDAVVREGEKIEVGKITFKTVKAPFVESVSPEGGGVLPDSKVEVVFDQEMDTAIAEQAFSFEPETEGEIAWEDQKKFIFTPTQLQKETHYTVKFAKGLRSLKGGTSEQAIEFEFDTIGAVAVAGWNPGYGAAGINRGTNINVTFNQAVDHASAESKFSISPNVNGSFSWSGNTLVFNPSSNLSYDTQYTVTIGSPVKTVNGLDSRQSYSSVFTTESQVVILNVPQYYQRHAFTCNVTAVAMALSYKGAASSEMGVYNGMAKDNTPCTKNPDGSIKTWGDPHSGYVGDINGGGSCGGYGVYWSPLVGYIQGRGRGAKVYSGWSVSGIAKEIENGNPVVLWGQNGLAAAYDKSWQTPGGKHIYAINGMHSMVAVGYIGPSSNPSHIIFNDPWRGRRTLTASDVLYGPAWAYFNRTAVVVY